MTMALDTPTIAAEPRRPPGKFAHRGAHHWLARHGGRTDESGTGEQAEQVRRPAAGRQKYRSWGRRYALRLLLSDTAVLLVVAATMHVVRFYSIGSGVEGYADSPDLFRHDRHPGRLLDAGAEVLGQPGREGHRLRIHWNTAG